MRSVFSGTITSFNKFKIQHTDHYSAHRCESDSDGTHLMVLFQRVIMVKYDNTKDAKTEKADLELQIVCFLNFSHLLSRHILTKK